MKFYICKHCGNIVTKLTSAGVPIKCCGENMVLLEAGVTDAAVEKHVPAVTVAHPMTAEHYIPWVALETETSASVEWLQPEQAPEVVFALAEGQKPKAVYAWCNLHGLWKAEL